MSRNWRVTPQAHRADLLHHDLRETEQGTDGAGVPLAETDKFTAEAAISPNAHPLRGLLD